MKTRHANNPRPSACWKTLWFLQISLTTLATTSFAMAAESEKSEIGPNYIAVGATGIDLNGSETSWRARTNTTSNFQGGIESLHYEDTLGSGWTLEMDSRAIFNEDEYVIDAVIEKFGVNRTKIGFENYRYWSDARSSDVTGSIQINPFAPSLSLDRSEFYIESTFYPSDVFDVTFRYTFRERDGEKASTVWGDSIYNSVKSVPSFWDIDEQRHTVELEAERRWDMTTIEGALRWDHAEDENRLKYARDYDETVDEKFLTQNNETERDNLSARGILDHKVSEQLRFNLSAMYSRIDADISGFRVFGAQFLGDPVYGSVDPALGSRDHQYLDLSGDFDIDQYVVTAGALYQPSEHWFFTPSLRVETRSQNGGATVSETAGATPGPELTSENENDYDSIAAEFGARYTGLTNWTFYSDAFASYGEGDHIELQYETAAPGALDVNRDTEYLRKEYKLTLGSNWYAHPKLTIAFQTYYQLKDNEYDHQAAVAAGGGFTNTDYSGYILDQERQTFDFNVRLNWRISPRLTSISRVDYKDVSIDTQYFGSSSFETGEVERYSYSQSLSFMASERLTLMCTINYVHDRFSTPAVGYYDAGNDLEVAESQMDYIYGDLTAVYVHDDSLDFIGTISALLSDNSNNKAVAVPYASDMTEYRATLQANKKLAANKTITLEYDYFDYKDDMIAGAGFSAHMISAKYEYRF